MRTCKQRNKFGEGETFSLCGNLSVNALIAIKRNQMNYQRLRSWLVSTMLAVCSIAAIQIHAQTVTVNGANCAAATVKLGAGGSIAIDTAGCGTVVTPVAPTITSGTPPATGSVGAAYSFTFGASGSSTIAWTVASGVLPAGLSLSSGGVLSGAPTAPGTFNFSVQAANGTLPNAVSPSFTITVTNLPAITSGPPASATPNVVYSHTFVASQTITTWTVSAGALPAGLGLTPGATSVILSGTPTVVGNTSFTISATNTNGTATQVVNFSVIALTPPTITSAAPPAGTANSLYTAYQFQASGTSPFTWSVNSGAIPTGMVLAATGALTGIPTAAGTYTFTVKVANGTLPDAISTSISMVIGAPQLGAAITRDINGSLITVPYSKVAKQAGAPHGGPSGGGTYPGGEINAWSVSPTACANTQPAISTLWYHNINFLDYGGQNTIDNLDFAPNQALVYGFIAPSIGSFTGYVGNIDIQTGTRGTPATSFVTISETPCDFAVAKVATATPCYTSNAPENGFGFRITNAPTAACQLVPGRQYYLNFRFQDARPSPIGSPTQDACTMQNAITCGAILRISITGAY